MYLRPVKWRPKCLFNLCPQKSPFCTIRNIENCPLPKFKKKVLLEKKTIVSLVIKSRNFYREGIRYVAKVYVVKIYVFKVCCVLTFSKQSTYGSKVVTFANLLI